MLASATGEALPGTVAALPMITTSLTNETVRGSSQPARATLVSGPTGTSVISPACASSLSTMNCAA